MLRQLHQPHGATGRIGEQRSASQCVPVGHACGVSRVELLDPLLVFVLLARRDRQVGWPPDDAAARGPGLIHSGVEVVDGEVRNDADLATGKRRVNREVDAVLVDRSVI